MSPLRSSHEPIRCVYRNESFLLRSPQRANSRRVDVARVPRAGRIATVAQPFHLESCRLQTIDDVRRVSNLVVDLHGEIVHALEPTRGIAKDAELRAFDVHLQKVDAIQM